MKKNASVVLALLLLVVFGVFVYFTFGDTLAPYLANPGAVIDKALRGLIGGLASFGQGLRDAFGGIRLK